MPEHVVLRNGSGDEFRLAKRSNASAFDRACALGRHEAGLLVRSLADVNRYSSEFRKLYLLAAGGLPAPTGVSRIRGEKLRQMVLDQLFRTGRLILASEDLALSSCGVGTAPPSLSASGAAGASWSGDSSKWTQEKKILSMHPDLRPKVEQVVHELTKRGFQPSVFFAWRSVAVQLEIFKKKHTKVKFSFHNVQKRDGSPNAYAADIIDRRWAWSDPARKNGFLKALGEEAKKQSLYWGGEWKKPDWAHVQLLPNSHLKRLKKESGL
jgi:hypothetical protein